MLKVFGGVYGSNKQDFDTLVDALTSKGFEVAYQNETSGTVIKEVNTLDDNENTES